MARITWSVPLGLGFRYSQTVWSSKKPAYRAQFPEVSRCCPHRHSRIDLAMECEQRTRKAVREGKPPAWL
jgi:hypothetical protein